MVFCFKSFFFFVGEVSVLIFWENDDWFYFKENEVFMELKYISVDYIRYVIFNVKVIICVWNLIDRYGEWDSYFLYNLFFILGSVINLNLRKSI